MFVYEKRLQYPVNIKQPNPALAKIIISQYGGLYCKKIYKKQGCCTALLIRLCSSPHALYLFFHDPALELVHSYTL